MAVMSRPARMRMRECPDSSWATPRMAATGGMRDARQAGKTAAMAVTTKPRTRPMTIVAAAITSRCSGARSRWR